MATPLPYGEPSPAREGDTGTPAVLRAMNQRTLLEHLREAGPTSRAELARRTGLSKPTVSEALAGLERAGLVRAAGPAAPSRGRTALLYEADASAAYVVGVDIGRAWIRVAAADLAGDVVARRDVRNRARSAAKLVRAVADDAHEVVADAGLAWEKVAQTVVASPGVFQPASGRLRHAPNLPGWTRPGLADALRDALPPSVAIDNDTNLAAVGEAAYGRGRGGRTFAYLSVGTGIGMGIVIDGVLFRGAHGAAGEIAYLPLPEADAGRAGGSARSRGVLEQAASADAVVRSARAHGLDRAISSKRVFDAGRAGDERARAAVEEEARLLALVVATVTAIVDPEFIVLGGGIGANLDLLGGPLEARLAELTPLEIPVVESELGQDAIVLGAIATALETAREAAFRRATA